MKRDKKARLVWRKGDIKIIKKKQAAEGHDADWIKTEEACTIEEVPTRAVDLSDKEILSLNLHLEELWDLHFADNDAKVVKGNGDLTRAQVTAGMETVHEEMRKRDLAEAGRRVRATRVRQVKNIIQAWQKLRTELDDWLKWAEYMDGDWVEAPNIHGEPVKEEIMQELFGHYVIIAGTRVFIQEKDTFASRDREWDASAAEKRIRAWADAEDGPNAKYGRAFLYHDSDVDGFGGYKLSYQDVIDGELKVVPRAIFAVAGALSGARGGLKIPEKAKQAIRKRVEGFYAKMRKEFDDESIGKE